MGTLNFRIWLEDVEAKANSAKDIILNYLKDKLHINDTDSILDMKLGSIDKSILSDLMQRGIVTTATADISQDIQNGSLTVQELVNKISGVQNNIPRLTYAKPKIPDTHSLNSVV